MLLKISDAVSKWMVFPGGEVRNQTERAQCDGFLCLSLCDPRGLFKVFLKEKFLSISLFIPKNSKM